MKIGSDCIGECCLCVCAELCLAGHGDDNFCLADKEQLIQRVKTGRYDLEKTEIILNHLANFYNCRMNFDYWRLKKTKDEYLRKREQIPPFDPKQLDEAIGRLLAGEV